MNTELIKNSVILDRRDYDEMKIKSESFDRHMKGQKFYLSYPMDEYHVSMNIISNDEAIELKKEILKEFDSEKKQFRKDHQELIDHFEKAKKAINNFIKNNPFSAVFTGFKKIDFSSRYYFK
ncbi:MAG: hypothetical protein KAR20_04400 [Candidatus Heimdallarchaeota archaeon]|nr:hypothetical protein [Candidatus Heimdallarchaeota archaeon]